NGPPDGSTVSPLPAGTSRRVKPSAGTAAPAASHSAMPGPAGSGSPSTAGTSPARSASTAPVDDRASTVASAAATTVVPLPPLADQQAINTGPLLGATTRPGSGVSGRYALTRRSTRVEART